MASRLGWFVLMKRDSLGQTFKRRDSPLDRLGERLEQFKNPVAEKAAAVHRFVIGHKGITTETVEWSKLGCVISIIEY